MRRLLSLPAIGLLALAFPANAQQATPEAAGAQDEGMQTLDEASAVRREANVEGVASQKRIDQLSDETDTLFARYRTALREVDAIAVYNQQMRELIASQEAEMGSLEEQLDRVELVGRSVTPMMLRMIDALDAFVDLDVPFLQEERTQRVRDLRNMMSRADVTNAEKYRAIMEAYQVENEFGRTIEAYRSTLLKDGKEMTVDFLRFGRIALVYQTLDETQSGVWDQSSRDWVELDDSYRSAIREGLRIARKQSAPDLIRLPVPLAKPAGEAG
jgi:hypothetical protein